MKPEPPKILRLELAAHERTDPFGLKLKAHFEEELAKIRQKNDSPGLTEIQTAVLRGHIQFLKGFIALWDPPLPKVASDARPRPRVDLGAQYG